MKRTQAAWILATLTAGLMTVSAGDITGIVTLKGTPPPASDITPIMENGDCKKLHSEMPKTKHYVVGAKGELADTIVYLEGVTGKSTGASAAPVVLDQKGCEYIPMIIAVQTGQKITVKNSDPLLHNVHAQPAAASGNPEKNDGQLPGAGDLNYTFEKPEMFMKFKCDVHNWMFAWVSIFDSPYYAMTTKDGAFTIKDVPPGKYKLVANHRKAGKVEKEIEVKAGEPVKADFTIELK